MKYAAIVLVSQVFVANMIATRSCKRIDHILEELDAGINSVCLPLFINCCLSGSFCEISGVLYNSIKYD